MSYFAGYASGSLVLPALSDKNGRKKFLGGAILVQSVAALGMLLFPKGYATAIVGCFFFIGCCSAIRVPSAMCLMYDSAPKRYHGIMNSVFFILELMTFIYQTIHFEHIHSSFYGPQFVGVIQAIIGFVLLMGFFPESPKWLYEKGRYKEAQQVFDTMAKTNGTQMTSDIAKYQTNDGDKDIKKKPKLSMREAFTNKRNIMNLCCMVSCFVGNSFCFYLLGIQMKYIRGKFYTNNMVGALSELAAFSTSGILIKFFGIKPTLVIAYMIALLGMAALIFTSTLNQFWLSIMILGCKFGISCAKSTAYLANYQVFPVTIVATAFGLCNVVARVSTIFAPFIAELKPDSIA